MEGNLAEELYSESLRLSETKFPEASTSNFQQNDLLDIDGDADLWEEEGSSPQASNKASDLDREWQRRYDQFHTIGYRDGLIAGKEASAQDGFNNGFKQSVISGYNWGLVRGLTSVLACLPDELKERLVGSQEQRNSIHRLHDSVQSHSTADALRLFNQDVNATVKQRITADSSLDEPNFPTKSSDFSELEKYTGKFRMLIRDSPSWNVHFLAPVKEN